MLKPAVPSAVATRRRRVRARRWRSRSRRRGSRIAARSSAVSSGSRGSCFQSATQLSTIVASAAPCTTWISRTSLKCCEQRAEHQRADAPCRAAASRTAARRRAGARAPARGRSPARARPSGRCAARRRPAGRPAPPPPARSTIGPVVSPDRMISANGMIAKPPNCSSVPNQMYGTRRQPSTERWLSERKPISARNGANSSGSESISATSQTGTPSSTIITRFSVPISSTTAMPTVTWNSDRRSRRRQRQFRASPRRRTAGSAARSCISRVDDGGGWRVS